MGSADVIAMAWSWMDSWNDLRDCLVGSWVEVAILGMSSRLNGRRARMLEAFIFVVNKEKK